VNTIAEDTKVKMTNIKDIKELRKLFKDTEWLTIKFTKKQIIKEQATHISNFVQPDDNKDEWYWNKNSLDASIDTKLQKDVYRFRLSPVQQRFYYQQGLYASVKFENNPSFTIYEVIGLKSRYANYYPTETKFWVNDFNNQIINIKYNRHDIWWNNFFRTKVDTTIRNNFDEMLSEKTFHLAYEKKVYKIVTAKGLDYKDARAKAEKDNPELVVNSQREDKSWRHLYQVKEDKLPDGDIDIFRLRIKDNTYSAY